MNNPVHDSIKPVTADEISDLETIELLFFAYRDFVSDSDKILHNLEFGRAHHRTLYFVSRNPGMTVAGLLSILKITKQSLARVLRQLIENGYILQTEGENDRRKRLLFTTQKGKELVRSLSHPQSKRIQRAYSKLEPSAKKHVIGFLSAMIEPQN